MMPVGGAVAIAIATLMVCCTAIPHQEQDLRLGGHNIGDHYNDLNDFRQREELDNFLKFLIQYENKIDDRNLGGIGGSTLLGRNVDAYEGNPMRGSTSELGGSSLLGKGLLGNKNLGGIGGSTLLGRALEDKMKYARYVDSLGGGNFVRTLDSLGGGNFVRTLDSIGGGNFVRNLDSIGGANFVKKNLDHIGGPNLVKRNLDSLGGGNLVRNLDSIGGGNFVRQVDPLGGGNFV